MLVGLFFFFRFLACREADERVLEERVLGDGALVGALGIVAGIVPGLDGLRVECRELQISELRRWWIAVSLSLQRRHGRWRCCCG